MTRPDSASGQKGRYRFVTEVVGVRFRQSGKVYYFAPGEIRAEMTFYEGRAVMLMDAYTSYDLHDDHSEALVPLPEFMQSFQRFFMDVLLEQLVLSRAESIAALERLLTL